jgi:hypothetical protein
MVYEPGEMFCSTASNVGMVSAGTPNKPINVQKTDRETMKVYYGIELRVIGKTAEAGKTEIGASFR